jgi:glycerophosphoryl diester phosphodiesterase
VDRRRAGLLLLPVAALAAAGVALARRTPRRRRGWAYLAGAPLLIAHRGGSALAPENTLLAFQRAIEWWRADILELDVQPTRDGEAVVFHDETLDRTTDGRGPVADHTLEQLRQLDAGHHFTPDGGATHPFRGHGIGISTLAEVFAALPGARINIEIKDGRAQERVWESIRDARATDRVLVAAGDSRNRARLRGYPVPVSAGKQEMRVVIAQLAIGRVLYMPAIDALQVPDHWEGRRIVTPELVDAAEDWNIPVHVWTVDEVEDMERLLDWGVAGVITDRPDRLARVLHDRVGRPLPPGPPDPMPEPFLERLLRP